MKSAFFERALRAFKLAAPFAMAVRTEDFAHCVEASLVGAKVLRDRTIDAKAIPCCVVGGNGMREPPLQLSLGLNERDVYDRLRWGDEPPMPFEEWKQAQGVPTLSTLADATAIHMAIEAQVDGKRVILDPTIGQLRAVHKINISLVEFFECDSGSPWPAFATRDGWELQYEDSPHVDAIEKRAAGYKIPAGWVNDLDELMQLAIDCKLYGDRFFAVMESQQPEMYQLAIARLTKLVRGGA
jgi:hypothetical protein